MMLISCSLNNQSTIVLPCRFLGGQSEIILLPSCRLQRTRIFLLPMDEIEGLEDGDADDVGINV
jgi:hypothetical protein